MRTLALWMALVLAAACAPTADDDPAGAVAIKVAPAPEVVIGGEVSDPDYQLEQAVSALRLDDGTIVVGNSATGQIRFFGGDGRLLRTIGRQGDGPGEFSGRIRLSRGTGRKLRAADGGDRRITVYEADGTVVGESPVEPGGPREFNGSDWLVDQFWVRGVAQKNIRRCVRHALASVQVDPTAPFMRVMVDQAGEIWVQPARAPEASTGWDVYDIAGELQGRATLPAGLQPLDVGTDYVLGRSLDSTGFEQIALYRLEREDRPATADCGSEAAASVAQPASAAESLPTLAVADLRNLIVAQEMHFAMNGAYAARADSIQWESANGYQLWMERASPRSWLAVLTGLPDGSFCVASVGAETPDTWAEGGVKCSQHSAAMSQDDS